MLEDFEENEPTQLEETLREKEIRERLDRATRTETIKNMVARYHEYGQPIDQEGYISGIPS